LPWTMFLLNLQYLLISSVAKVLLGRKKGMYSPD